MQCEHKLITFCYLCYVKNYGKQNGFLKWSNKVCNKQNETYEEWLKSVLSVRFATEKEQIELYNRTEQWIKITPMSFKSARYDAKVAVAEFLANQSGLTLAIPSWRSK